jgi:hypothetical protein
MIHLQTVYSSTIHKDLAIAFQKLSIGDYGT